MSSVGKSLMLLSGSDKFAEVALVAQIRKRPALTLLKVPAFAAGGLLVAGLGGRAFRGTALAIRGVQRIPALLLNHGTRLGVLFSCIAMESGPFDLLERVLHSGRLDCLDNRGGFRGCTILLLCALLIVP